MVEDFVILLETVASKEFLHRLHIKLLLEWYDWTHELIPVRKMLVKEIQYHVATLSVVVGIHCHFPEKIFDFGIYHSQSAETVPEIVKSEYGLGARLRRLIFHPHK